MRGQRELMHGGDINKLVCHFRTTQSPSRLMATICP